MSRLRLLILATGALTVAGGFYLFSHKSASTPQLVARLGKYGFFTESDPPYRHDPRTGMKIPAGATLTVFKDGRKAFVLKPEHGTTYLADPQISPDGQYISAYEFSTEGADGNILIWESGSGKLATSIENNLHHIGWIRFSPDSQMLATPTGVYAVRGGHEIWRWGRRGYLRGLPKDQVIESVCVVWSDDSKRLLIGGREWRYSRVENRPKLLVLDLSTKSRKDVSRIVANNADTCVMQLMIDDDKGGITAVIEGIKVIDDDSVDIEERRNFAFPR